MHPLNDKLKVKISPDGPFSDEAAGVEKGIVVELPPAIAYFGFHSFAFESSFDNGKALTEKLDLYKQLEGKLVFWESLQDRGRRFKEGDEQYAIINMTDIIAYSDDVNINVEAVSQVGSAGSFNL